MSAYFTNDFAKFFKELERNNNKDWFDANRKRYEESVKKPFHDFMNAVAGELQKVYPKSSMRDNIKIFRINRDIRFSKDKTPYKTHMAGMVSPVDKKDMTSPGFYTQANHNDIRVYSGVYMPDKDQLEAIRDHIVDNMKEFDKLVNDKKFKLVFGEILGEKNKRLPKEYQEAAEKQPFLYNKGFYWFFKLSPKDLTSDKLVKTLIDNYKKAMPLNTFFDKALGIKH